jgi:hypothetical protein
LKEDGGVHRRSETCTGAGVVQQREAHGALMVANPELMLSTIAERTAAAVAPGAAAAAAAAAHEAYCQPWARFDSILAASIEASAECGSDVRMRELSICSKYPFEQTAAVCRRRQGLVGTPYFLSTRSSC